MPPLSENPHPGETIWENTLFEPTEVASVSPSGTVSGNATVIPNTPAAKVVVLDNKLKLLDNASVDQANAEYTAAVAAGPIYLMAHAFDPTAWRGIWTAETEYQAGAVVFTAGASSAQVLRCTVAGTSGTSTPTSAGVDGSAEWEELGTVSETAPVVNFLVT